MRRSLLLAVCVSACVGNVQGTPPLDGGALEDAGFVDSGFSDGGLLDSGIVDAGFDAGTFPRRDGGYIDAGTPNFNPAWLAGKPLNEWFEIPNTSGAGGSAVDAYSGMGLRESTTELIVAAAGGHHDGASNAVYSLMLAADAPVWILRSASSAVTPEDVAYYPDGLPASRHTYQSTHVIESLHRAFLFGARFTWGNSFTFPTVDGFDLDTNLWDPKGTWPDVPSGYGAVKVRATEEVFSEQLRRFDPVTRTWSSPVMGRTNDPVRWPIAHDSTRNQLFSLQWGDGQGYDPPKLSASKIPLPAGPQVSITFSDAGTAVQQFETEQPAYAAMDYDPDNDRFLFYSGLGPAAGRIYVVTPTATAQWSMEVLQLGPGSMTPPATSGAGVNNRFRYVPAFKGFVLVPNRSSNLFFIRTAL